jgi:hypothetical protein
MPHRIYKDKSVNDVEENEIAFVFSLLLLMTQRTHTVQ